MKLVMGISDRIVVLHHGELLAEGTPDDIRRHDEVQRVYLGQTVMTHARGRQSQRLVRPQPRLQGVASSVGKGEAVCMIGRNGAGKTTTLRSIMGLVARREGAVTFDGAEHLAEPTHRRFALGLAYVPEERRIVPGLTVQENLRLGLVASPTARARPT